MKLPKTIGRKLYWTSYSLQGKGAMRDRFESLSASQWMTPNEIKELQFQKFIKLITHAYERVPYYREVMQHRGLTPADFTSPEDIMKLPRLTKTILRERQTDLISTEANREEMHKAHSSGSTGEKSEFYHDKAFSSWSQATHLRTYQWCGDWRLGDPIVTVMGSMQYWRGRPAGGIINRMLSNSRELFSYRLGDDELENLMNFIVRFKPTLISGYTTSVYLIARYARQQGVQFPFLKAVQVLAEPLPSDMRATMGEVFDCQVYDKYGSRETGIIAHESPNREQMCIQAENVFVEFLNNNDEMCDYGESGQVLFTTLNNYSMPLIRFETSDIAAPVEGICSSGIGLPRMTAVHGRMQDLIVTPTGRFIHPQLFSIMLRQIESILWFQVIQNVEDTLHIRVYAPGGVSDDEKQKISNLIEINTGFKFQIDYEDLPAMPESTSGKFRLCINYLSATLPEQAELQRMYDKMDVS